MSTYADLAALAGNESFRARVGEACRKAATDVLNEAGTTANHAARARWATFTIDALPVTANRMLSECIANPSVGGTAPTGASAADGDLYYVVSSRLDAHAALYHPGPNA